MPLPLRPQSCIHAAEMRLALHGDSRHVIPRMAQAGVTPAPHYHLSALATLLRDGCDPAMRAQHLIVSCGQGLGGFRKEPGCNFPSDGSSPAIFSDPAENAGISLFHVL